MYTYTNTCTHRKQILFQVIQRRADGQVDFDRSWMAYKLGFGELNEDFWLANQNIHRLTSLTNQKLRVELQYLGHGNAYVEYSSFSVDSVQQLYVLNITGYTGTNCPGECTALVLNTVRLYCLMDNM